MIDVSDLAQSLGKSEREDLEFKVAADERDPIRKAICALANDLSGRDGGTLVIGVDKHGVGVGVVTDDSALLSIVNFRNEGKILPPPTMTVEASSFEGQPVIVVRVQAATALPVTVDGKIWVRVGPSTRVATKHEEHLLIERRRTINSSFDQHPVVSATLRDLDDELFRSTYLRAAVPSDVLAENDRTDEERMAALGVLRGDDQPSVFGILLVGLDPSRHLPGAYVQFVRYGGNDVMADVRDAQEIRANVIWLMQQLEHLMAAHNRTRLLENGRFEQRERQDFPDRALREVIANAVVHRDYELSSAPIRISWFDDRVEIANPGGPFGSVTDSNFDRANDYRNPALAAAMKHLGYVNRFGRGVALIRAELEANGNPAPEFVVDQSWWAVTLHRPS